MQKLSDRQRMIAAYGSLLSNPMLPVRYTPPNEISELTGRVIGHAHDDGTDRPAMILEGADGFVHIIPHDQAIERYRAKGRLAVGQVVTLKRIDGRLTAHDAVQMERPPKQDRIDRISQQLLASRGHRGVSVVWSHSCPVRCLRHLPPQRPRTIPLHPFLGRSCRATPKTVAERSEVGTRPDEHTVVHDFSQTRKGTS